MAITQWWLLQDKGEAPTAVFGVDSEGLVRRYVPGMGWVDWPSLTEYVYGGERGARQVDEAEAMTHMVRNVGRVNPDVIARNMGDAPTIRGTVRRS